MDTTDMFREALKYSLLERVDISIASIAESLGMNKSVLNAYIQKKTDLSKETRNEIAKILGVSYDVMIAKGMQLLSKSKNPKTNPMEKEDNVSGYGKADDLDFVNAEKRINFMEAYEYYISESFPVSHILNDTISKYPHLEPILEVLVSSIAGAIDKTWTKEDIIEYAIDILQNEVRAAKLESEDDAPGNGREEDKA